MNLSELKFHTNQKIKGQKIEKIDVRANHTGQIIINSITLENGEKLEFNCFGNTYVKFTGEKEWKNFSN